MKIYGARGRRVNPGDGLKRLIGVEAGAGALLVSLVPEIATLPDAVAQAGDGADGGVVFIHADVIPPGPA